MHFHPVHIERGNVIIVVLVGYIRMLGFFYQTFEAEVADRTPRDSFYHCLKNSAHQFHNQQEGEHYILAGYPWFKCRARDMFISLPGLTLALDEVDQFEDVMKTAEKAIRSFINDEPAGYKIYEMEHPDVLLWAVWALQQYPHRRPGR